jgi:threonine/homoserine/homoserine lactone efflux protein
MVWGFVVAARGRVMALAAVAGIGLGLAVAAVIAGLGLTAILINVPVLFDALRWLGTAYLLYLAYEAWVDGDGTVESAHSRTQAFSQGLLTNVLNPKAYLFYAAVLPQFMDASLPPFAQLVMLSAIYVAVATTIHAGIAVLAGSAATWLQHSPKARVIRRAMALAIAAAAIWFFYSTRVMQ